MQTIFRLLLIAIGSLTIFSSIHIFITNRNQPEKLISPLSTATSENSNSPAVQGVAANTTSIADVINAALKGTKGTYAMYYKNLKTNEIYARDDTRSFLTASLYKIWIMATVYEQIENGKLKKDQILKESIPSLNKKFNLSDDVAEKTEGEIELSVSDALEQMITVSDNYAALLLSSKIRLSTVRTFLTKNGFAHSKLNDPVATPADIGLFFDKLYNGKLISKNASEEMIALLKRQKLNDRIPKYLPDEISVAHKTGELEGVKHDAGIIYAPSGNYILVVMSQSDEPLRAAERIANVSKNVYEFLEE